MLSTKQAPCEILNEAWRKHKKDENTLITLHPDTIWILFANGKLTCRISSGLKQTELTNPSIDCEWIPTRSFNRVSSYLVNDYVEGAVVLAIQTKSPEIVDQLLQSSLLDDFTVRKVVPAINQGMDDHMYYVPNSLSFHKRGYLAKRKTDRNRIDKTRTGLEQIGETRTNGQEKSENSRTGVKFLKPGKITGETRKLSTRFGKPSCCGANKEEPMDEDLVESPQSKKEETRPLRPKLSRQLGVDTVDGEKKEEYSLRKNKLRK